ncbi:MAG: hypothetical protein SYC29_17030 [Planctomycetota bacterium]|nr:hypothetical protein [Planctomycetota bacterium]
MNGTHDQFENEARLTAYVLGELDETEAAAIEAQMEHDPSLRDEIEAIRRTTQMLDTELKAEPAPGLTEGQREAIAAGPRREGPVIFTIRRVWGGVAVAAAACVVFALFLTMNPSASRDDEQFAIGQSERAKDAKALDQQDDLSQSRSTEFGAAVPATPQAESRIAPPEDAKRAGSDGLATRLDGSLYLERSDDSIDTAEDEAHWNDLTSKTSREADEQTSDDQPTIVTPLIVPDESPAKAKGSSQTPGAVGDRGAGDGRVRGGGGGGARGALPPLPVRRKKKKQPKFYPNTT